MSDSRISSQRVNFIGKSLYLNAVKNLAPVLDHTAMRAISAKGFILGLIYMKTHDIDFA